MTRIKLSMGCSLGLGLFVLVGPTAGCKPGKPPAGEVGTKAFEPAAPELRAACESALAADKTNGYAAAYSTLLRICHPRSLTPEQLQAVSAIMHSINGRLEEGLRKGDLQAQKAVQEIARMDKDGRISD